MTARKHKPGSFLGNLLGLIGFSAAAGALVAASLTPGVAAAAAATNSGIDMFQALPDYATINQQQDQTVIYGNRDDKPVEIARLFDQNRQVVDLKEVSVHAQNAAIAAEDRRFYSHAGVDAQSLARAVMSQFGVGGRDSGGSTLTMQLVRQQIIMDAFDRNDQETIQEQRSEDYNRKLREIKLAMALESTYTKDEILLAYLNIANFGGTIYGIQSAAQEVFGIDASKLNPAQAASLIAIVNEPANLSLLDPSNFAENEVRRNWVLGQMANEGFITQEELEEYSAIPVDEDYVNYSPSRNGCFAATESARYFCDYVEHVLNQDQVHGQHIFGQDATANANALKQGGYQIYTTIDLDLNDRVQELVRQYAPPEENRYDSGAAVTMLEVSTGRILTMVQNKHYDPRDYSNSEEGQPHGTTALNYNATFPYGGSRGFQSGSTHKIFTLAQWIRDGYSVNEVLDTKRKPRTIDVCGSPYPEQYDPQNNANMEWGRQSVTDIMVNSLNTGITEMATRLDVCDIQDLAADMGIVNAIDPEKPLLQMPSVLIGGAQDNSAPISIAQAFATIANDGVHCEPLAIDRIVDRNGNEITPPQPDCNRVLSSEEASVMQHTLREVNRRNANTNPGNAPVLSKTGTNDSVEHTWTSGSSPNVAASAWIGNAGTDKQSLDDLGLWTNVRNLFRESMWEANNRYPGGQFLEPDAETLRGNTVPLLDVAGMDVEEAIDALESAGFENVEVGSPVEGEQDEGTVEYTAPGAGTLVTPESMITIYPSDGSLNDNGSGEWPDLNGLTLREARSAVDDAGFNSDNIQITPYDGSRDQECVVLAQNPDPGTTGSSGDPISVVVGVRANGSTSGC